MVKGWWGKYFPTLLRKVHGNPKVSVRGATATSGCLLGFEPNLRDPQSLVLTITL